MASYRAEKQSLMPGTGRGTEREGERNEGTGCGADREEGRKEERKRDREPDEPRRGKKKVPTG